MHTNKAVDIFGEEVGPGTIVMFVSSAAKLDVAVVKKVEWRADGRLMGYKVESPYLGRDGKPQIMTKHLRPGRELACVPASKVHALASAQACLVDNFANRILYLASQAKKNSTVLS